MIMKFLYILFLFCNNIFFAQIVAKVIAIKDGDTVVVLLEGNIQKTLRLAEVIARKIVSPLVKMPSSLRLIRFLENK